jgi:hypothetical protein
MPTDRRWLYSRELQGFTSGIAVFNLISLFINARPLILASGRPPESNGRKTQEPLESSAIVGAVTIVAQLIFSVPLCLLT